MSTGQQQQSVVMNSKQNVIMTSEQMAAAQERLAALQEERNVINQELMGLHTGLIALNEKIVANNTAQKLITDELRAAGIALLGDVSAASASAKEAFQIGKLTSFGVVFVGRRDIGEGLAANLFEIPRSLRDMTGEIYTCDNTVRKVSENGGYTARWSVGSENYERVCFASDPDNYRKNAMRYVREHVRKHAGDSNATSRAFISPWVKPVEDMVKHKLAHGDESDFVLPKRSGSDNGDIVQSGEPHRDDPDDRQVVYGSDGDTGWNHRDTGRFGCALFVAAPAPR